MNLVPSTTSPILEYLSHLSGIFLFFDIFKVFVENPRIKIILEIYLQLRIIFSQLNPDDYKSLKSQSWYIFIRGSVGEGGCTQPSLPKCPGFS